MTEHQWKEATMPWGQVGEQCEVCMLIKLPGEPADGRRECAGVQASSKWIRGEELVDSAFVTIVDIKKCVVCGQRDVFDGRACVDCWEVESRLEEYIKSKKGLQFVINLLVLKGNPTALSAATLGVPSSLTVSADSGPPGGLIRRADLETGGDISQALIDSVVANMPRQFANPGGCVSAPDPLDIKEVKRSATCRVDKETGKFVVESYWLPRCTVIAGTEYEAWEIFSDLLKAAHLESEVEVLVAAVRARNLTVRIPTPEQLHQLLAKVPTEGVPKEHQNE